jgi:hypothetical protein
MALRLDPTTLSFQGNHSWQNVMEYGEFIKYIHNAIEWENVLYINYPYFWDTPVNWKIKKFLKHPDPLHQMFLRSGAARVVLTIRPGYEEGFTDLMETPMFPPPTAPTGPSRRRSRISPKPTIPAFPQPIRKRQCVPSYTWSNAASGATCNS